LEGSFLYLGNSLPTAWQSVRYLWFEKSLTSSGYEARSPRTRNPIKEKSIQIRINIQKKRSFAVQSQEKALSLPGKFNYSLKM
jgi:hypothetical protein